MAIHEIRLVRRETVAEGTIAFWFSEPSGFRHQAGQSLLMRLINAPETDREGDARTFTIASAPHEAELMIATRMRDTAFKRFLRAAPVGTVFRVDGPAGEMVLHEDASRPAVFLAGGIGITPFRAIAQSAANERLPHRLYLFYSNRRPEDIAFLAELQCIERLNPNYRLIATMVEPEKSAQRWVGETGFIRRGTAGTPSARHCEPGLLLRRPASDDDGDAADAGSHGRWRTGDAIRGILWL
jgi:ferredoxin-NADP reductase